MKKILFLFILLLPIFANGAITNLTTNGNVKLGEKLVITGDYNEANVLCSFYTQDTNNVTVERLSDEYTFSDGHFYSERILNEPPYFRATTYNLVTRCGADTATTTFAVTQMRGIDDFFFGSIFYLADNGVMLIFFILILIVVVIGGSALIHTFGGAAKF